jgi:hypothetical protein
MARSVKVDERVASSGINAWIPGSKRGSNFPIVKPHSIAAESHKDKGALIYIESPHRRHLPGLSFPTDAPKACNRKAARYCISLALT